MRSRLTLTILALLSGCQAVAPMRNSAVQGDALARLESVLPGEYDNHQQVQASAHAACTAEMNPVPAMPSRTGAKSSLMVSRTLPRMHP